MKSLLFLIVLFSAASGIAADAPRPNILYFYVDDMGWGSIGPNGQAERRAKGLPNVQTPNLDRLAAEGLNFTRAYGCTVCSPARSSQQTGFHQGHTFADRNDPNNAKKAMRADDVLMGDALAAAGYVTGYWGKWGYGGSKDQTNPVIENIQTLPTSHGYQFVLAELHHVRAHTFFQPTLWSAPAKAGAIGGMELIPNTMAPFKGKAGASYPKQPSNHNHPDYPDTGYCDDAYAFAALDFVRTQAKSNRETGKPFFGLLAVQIPHAPFDEISVLPGWDQDYSKDPHFSGLADQSKQWAAMVTRIDAHFGNILGALDDPDGNGDPSDSVAENTLVIFMSDNGGPGGKSNGELDANGGLRGNKGSIYEGGIRVPTIMRWPAKITADSLLKPGTEDSRVMDVSDLMPTFCELAGVAAPVGLDGVSLAPLLLNSGERRTRKFLIHEAGKSQSIIRGKDKLVRTPKGVELYDLDADHSEKNNIAKGNKKLVKELEELLLGERVDEPRGCANTYHHWTGSDGAKTSDPKNWSDYEYANSGKSYQSDKGAPQLSWTAVMENRGRQASRAQADANLEFLGLEIRGGEAEATQELILGPKTHLTGRNEIRLSRNAILTVDGGKVSSLRWIEVKEGAVLQGKGKIDAEVYNSGAVSLAEGPGNWEIFGNYHQSSEGRMEVALAKAGIDRIVVKGIASLGGNLSVTTGSDLQPKVGDSFPLLSASAITGRFSNERDEVIGRDGARYEIRYHMHGVRLILVEEADQGIGPRLSLVP